MIAPAAAPRRPPPYGARIIVTAYRFAPHSARVARHLPPKGKALVRLPAGERPLTCPFTQTAHGHWPRALPARRRM